jgi:glycosyltransferase involved in cell wall biosynthesis
VAGGEVGRSPDVADVGSRRQVVATPPSVDIVVNNFNYGLFLGTAIDSALAQTYEHVHVIVVDDGSTDDSREVMASYGDRIEPVLKDNGGQASAMNAGLIRSRGDIVIFLDADDALLPHAAERVAASFRARPDAAKTHYRMTVVDADGVPTGELKPPRHLALPSGDLRRRMVRFPFDLAWLPTSGNAFAGDVLRKVTPIPEEEYPILADYYIVLVSALFGPVEAIEEPLAQMRLHGGNRHQPMDASLDLGHLRRTIDYTARTNRHLAEFARRLELDWDPGDASMSDVANRAVSIKLDPASHPVSGDTLPSLVRLGLHAARRRFDVNVPMKLAFAIWLVGFAAAPRPVARSLATKFLYPERRPGLNRWLALMHRRR